MFRNILHFLLSLWFGVLIILTSHFARAFHELQCIVRVISAARFENTWSVHSANFENGTETGLNRLENYNDWKIIMIEHSLSSIFRIGKVRSAISFTVILFCQETFQPSITFRKENGSDYEVLLQ